MVRADLVTSVVLLVLGVATMVESWRMPRFEEVGADVWSSPGVVPGLLGVALTLMAAILFLRSVVALRRPAEGPAGPAAEGGWGRAALAAGLCILYALGLVGRMPFWLATFLFVLAFVTIFDLTRRAEAGAGPGGGRGGAGGGCDRLRGALRLPVDLPRSASLRRAACRGCSSSCPPSWSLRPVPVTLFNVFWATLLGITVGALPGLTATLGIALLTTLTFHMEAQTAILVLICMYVGSIYGGSRSAILLNIPGTPASAATTLDGFPLARAGAGGAGDGARDVGVVPRQPDRHGGAGGGGAGAGRVRAVVPLAGVLLAGALRGADLGAAHHHRRHAQGLDLGDARAARRDGRAGEHPCLPAVQLRLDRSVRRARALAGARRRLRFCRDHRGDEGAGLRDGAGRLGPGAAARCASSGATSGRSRGRGSSAR